MPNEHVWRETTEEGEKREVRATKFARQWKLQSKLKGDPAWTYHDKPSLADLEALRDLIFRKYQRRRAATRTCSPIDDMIAAQAAHPWSDPPPPVAMFTRRDPAAIPMDQTRAWIDADSAHQWHPFTQMRDWCAPGPRTAGHRRRAAARRCATAGDANTSTATRSIWTNLHGHNHPRINAAIARQLEAFAHCSFLGLTHPPRHRTGRGTGRRCSRRAR